ncbi:hypothetical protein OG875_07920 [Streptomyces sp. NBC_01498]|uniref:hypothetical protein n=1 Tax=Streptomyces sp. NBC_01498 TaxID=2975870 RepID=UPI002E7B5397|nr:hypothetical protein [Streptomyces sp. NBC_01498]WTL24533.1 hypothetical protein OG875_07920 [Streptomyces sp. NBC_01498]
MTGGTSPSPGEASAGIQQLEGYLLAQSRVREAKESAVAFADRMPWLTTAQHEEVVGLYTQDHIDISRRALELVVARAAELRAEYSARYEQLKRRLLCLSLATLLGASCVLLWHAPR